MRRGNLEPGAELWRDTQWPHFSVSGAIGRGSEGQGRQRQPCGRAKGQGPWLEEDRKKKKKKRCRAPRPAQLCLSRALGKEASSGTPPRVSHNRGKLREQEGKAFSTSLNGKAIVNLVSISEAQPTLGPERTDRWPLLLAPCFYLNCNFLVEAGGWEGPGRIMVLAFAVQAQG